MPKVGITGGSNPSISDISLHKTSKKSKKYKPLKTFSKVSRVNSDKKVELAIINENVICKLCERTISMNSLRDHYKNIHNQIIGISLKKGVIILKDKPVLKYKCEECDVMFNQKKYRVHMLNEHNLRYRFKGGAIVDIKDVEQLQREQLPIPQHKCRKCSKKFDTNKAMRDHVKNDFHLKAFKCQHSPCDKKFSYLDTLNRHCKIHHNEPQPSKEKHMESHNLAINLEGSIQEIQDYTDGVNTTINIEAAINNDSQFSAADDSMDDNDLLSFEDCFDAWLNAIPVNVSLPALPASNNGSINTDSQPSTESDSIDNNHGLHELAQESMEVDDVEVYKISELIKSDPYFTATV